MRSYGQLCAVARALDVVGDRWTLLIVRELLTRGQARFTELQKGLPGVAPNLLAQRLKTLKEQGVLQHDPFPTSAAGSGPPTRTRCSRKVCASRCSSSGGAARSTPPC